MKTMISKVVKCFSPWLEYFKVLALKRKQKFDRVKPLATTAYTKQRSMSGRRAFLKTLQDKLVKEDLISWFILESVDKWGDLGLIDERQRGSKNKNGHVNDEIQQKIEVNGFELKSRPNYSSEPGVSEELAKSTDASRNDSCDTNLPPKIFARDTKPTTSDTKKDVEDGFKTSSPDIKLGEKSTKPASSDKESVEEDNGSTSHAFSAVPEHLKVDLDTLCNTFQLQPDDFRYQPDAQFVIWMDPTLTSKVFNYKLKRFNPHGGWPTVINRAFPQTQQTCSFSADHGVQSYGAKQFFCKMYGHCGKECGLSFNIVLPDEPIPGKPTKVIVKSKGAFVLIQSKSTSRQLRNLDRDDMKKVLERVKSKAVVLRNLNHISGLRALHRNHPQVSSGSLRQIKVEAEKEKLLHENPEIDILMFKKESEEKLSVSKVIRGFIQHINTTPGFLKLLMYDERSLRFHVNQYTKGTTKCFLDASGQFVSKTISKEHPETKEPYVYVIMGENCDGLTYPIAEMVSENGNKNLKCLAFTIKST